jgi:carbon storage regulator CsrA
MLVLSRRVNERIVFPQINASVQVVSVNPGTVRLGIEAPPEVAVFREEVRHRLTREGQEGTHGESPPIDARLRQFTQLLGSRLEMSHTGLAVLRRQLQGGLREAAELTLEKIESELLMLRQRLEREAERAASRPAFGAHKTTALLVEDNANERELLASFLRTAGLDVATAGDGAAALDYLHSHRQPDMVLLDMGLPRCDGATVVRNLRCDPAYANLKIFAVSGHVPEEYDIVNGPTGVNRWFHKPINPDELIRSLTQEIIQSSWLQP